MLDPSREHEAAHGHVNHGFGDFGSPLVAAVETAIASQPAESSFRDPAPGQDDEFGHSYSASGCHPVASARPDVFWIKTRNALVSVLAFKMK